MEAFQKRKGNKELLYDRVTLNAQLCLRLEYTRLNHINGQYNKS